MTPESKSLQQFLQINLSHKFKHISQTRFSSKASTFLASIFENIKKADDDFDYVDVVTSQPFENEIPKGIHYKLCPENARNHIENMTSIGQTCRFSVNGRKITVHLVYEYKEGDRHPSIKKQFSEIWYRIYLLIHLLSGYSRTQCSQTLSIYLYLTSIKKTLSDCDRDCTIGNDNVNTAFTFTCKRKNEVYLYRKEEWFKVLTHELFHSLGLDFSEYDCTEVEKQIFNIFPVKVDLRIYEAYTELWGELVNAMFISYFSLHNYRFKSPTLIGGSSGKVKLPLTASQCECVSNREPDKMIRKLEYFLYQERMFSVYQSSKILTHFGMSYDDLYSKNNNILRSYKETTPVLSYYIIKNILMFHIDAFMEWCIQHNGSSLEFNKTNIDSNMNHFITFIREHYDNHLLVESMNQARTWFLKQENNQRYDKVPITTMRMTVLEDK